ncbi:MAG: hypothetical protein RBT76_05455 [candidate division Zixibacteria bacterium]|jgi:hypothetical protein|nr:hypothetical protein [candidate division Zixibacteria bacterium]
MISAPRLLARIALFSALAYVVGWACYYIPNVNLIFFVAFSAGFLWGVLPGVAVAIVGEALFSAFNPGGPADPVVFAAQVVGMGFSGLIGGLFRAGRWHERLRPVRIGALAVAAAVVTILFYLPVNSADAWVYQPFWPRFTVGLVAAIPTLVSNMLAFPLLFGITRHLYDRERVNAWSR